MYTFNGTDVNISIGQYPSGRKAISLVDVEDGLSYAIATTNLPDLRVKSEDEVLIKDYSENEGILDFLISHNIVIFTGKTVVSGWVELHICILNPREQWVGNRKLFDYDLVGL
jgi:hypothetical protein